MWQGHARLGGTRCQDRLKPAVAEHVRPAKRRQQGGVRVYDSPSKRGARVRPKTLPITRKKHHVDATANENGLDGSVQRLWHGCVTEER